MIDAMAVVYAAENNAELKDITRSRSVAAIPVGGRYRIIDFILSNMVNSGIRNIGIITQSHYSSLMGHLGPGKEWDLDRKRDGLFILPPYVGHDNRGWYRGSVEALHSIMSYIKRSEQKYVVISGEHMVCNMTYNDAYQYHIEKGADITLIYKDDRKMSEEELKRNVLVQIDDEGKIMDMAIHPAIPKSAKVSMQMYIIERSLLEYLIEEGTARGCVDFESDLLLKKMDTLKIFGFPFSGYTARIDSILSYYKHNMDLLDPGVRNQLFFKQEKIYTRVKDEVPARYTEEASVQNCLVADGCVIEGEVENSVLFRGVKIYRGAKVKNSIIMQNSEVLENAVLENVILDKDVIIKRSKKLIGQENYPVVIGKKVVI